MTFPILGGNGAVAGYSIDNSLRFNDGDSPQLSRSTGTTNKRTFTVSVWVKRATNGARQVIWSSDKQTNDTGDGSKGGSGIGLQFWNDDQFYLGAFGGNFQIRSNGLQRDNSAWYHIVAGIDTTQSDQNNRAKLYINGENVSSLSAMVGQNTDIKFATNRIGVKSETANYSDSDSFLNYLDGYIAELHVIDGTQLQASDFGEYDDTGIWKPKEYSGSYGSDGYYLDFENSGSLGTDQSGNGNNFTATNLASTDQTTDTPTNNFCTLNPLNKMSAPTTSEANTQLSLTSNDLMTGTQYVSSGKWYYEAEFDSGSEAFIGWLRPDVSSYSGNTFQQGGSLGWYSNNGSVYKDGGGGTSYSTSYATGSIIGCALNLDDNQVTWYKNGTSQGTMSITAGNYVPMFCTGGASVVFKCNFGGVSSFTVSSGNTDDNGYGNFEYAPPSGYLALCTQNLATALSPTIDDGSAYFHTQLYTGTGSARSITNDANAGDFQPDWIWATSRSNGYNNGMFDSSRGVQKELTSNTTNAEATLTTGVSSFDSDGFSFSGSAYNTSAYTFVAWQWKANGGTTSSNTDGDVTSTVQVNSTSKFSIFTYTGNGNNLDTVGHGLGTTPDFCVIKGRSSGASGTQRWFVKVPAVCGASEILELDTTNAKGDSGNGIETMSSTTVTLGIDTGNANGVNESGLNYVGYAFASVEGYSKIGSYTGNGSTDGTFIYTGFRPAWVMIKRTDSTGDWHLVDNKRNGFNVDNDVLLANRSDAEFDVIQYDILSNGFKLRSTASSNNASGGSYIYMCFSANPFVSSSGVPVTAR